MSSVTSVLAEARVPAKQAGSQEHDSWVKMPARSHGRTNALATLQGTLSNLAKDYARGCAPSVEVPPNDELRPVDEHDIQAADYLAATYDD